MILLFSITSILLSMIGTFYLQLPTFILALGYKWSHNYPIKRWIFRILALSSFVLFLVQKASVLQIILTSIPFLFFWIFSLFNANPNLFIALNDKNIIKQKKKVYHKTTEIVGYVDESGTAICYPLSEMVMPRHLLNDIFNDNPLLISYCAACRSCMVYNPIIDGKQLTFDVVGVRRRNMVIRDIETGTLWQQGTGEAMYGKLKGKRLDFLPYQQMNLSDWLEEYPDSFIAKESNNIKKGIVPKKKLMKVLEKVTGKFIAPGKTDLSGLELREKVWGLEYNGINKAYPVSELQKVSHFIDTIGDEKIEITYNPKNKKITGKNIKTNKIMNFQNHWWFGWKEFHPNTKIWKSK